jgi:glycosyltransferase involved in cell wall biosynthesis
MTKRIVISVISDLVTDQRIHKVATTLQQKGYTITVIGAKRKKSRELENRPYATRRIHLVFQKGFAMYAEWNFRLFFFLLFAKADILLANDLDTLLPNFLVSKCKRQQLVYDSHEYFTEQEELQDRRFVKNVWLRLERFLVPRLKYCYTVNESIAAIYYKKYGVQFKVVRNMPILSQFPSIAGSADSHLQVEQKILLTQGVGLHSNRGLEELILSMQLVTGNFVLYIVGDGLALPKLKVLVQEQQLEQKVLFPGILPPDVLKVLTAKAFCGFSLDKPTCLNYVYSLPNKLFDFIHAGIPVIGSNLPEVSAIITDYHIGLVIDAVTPESIAAAVNRLESDRDLYSLLKQNTQTAKKELCWEQDAVKLISLIEGVFTKKA